MRYLICLLVILAACGNQEKKGRIAILTPVTHPSLELCEKGFKEELGDKYEYVVYNSQGNQILMRTEVEEIGKGQYDLVLTICTTPTLMATEVFAKKGIQTPIVFTAVNITEQISGDYVTGVKELLKFEEEIEALLFYKPGLARVLLVYNPAIPGLQKDREEIERILAKRNIALQTAEVFQTNELKAKVSPFMENSDALIVLKDNTVVSGIEVLSKLCREKKIPLMASDLDSPDRGAAFGYGVNEVNFGIEAAKKARQILEEGVRPGVIPITPVTDFTLRVNREAARDQGIEL